MLYAAFLLVLTQLFVSLHADSTAVLQIQITDALSERDLTGVAVRVYKSDSNNALEAENSYTTSGTVTFNVVPATYNVSFSCPGYQSLSRLLSAPSDSGSPDAVTMNPIVFAYNSGTEFYGVLTWGSTPLDLDAWMVTPCDCNVFWDERSCTCNGIVAQLNQDVQDGFGPETITVRNVESLSGASYTVWTALSPPPSSCCGVFFAKMYALRLTCCPAAVLLGQRGRCVLYP